MKNKKGFTLIELLVVVAIMGLLTALAVIALNQARARARDARRISDIKQIQTALELYYLDGSAYPDGGTVDVAMSLDGDLCISSGNAIAATCSGTTYMAVVPLNPTPRTDGDCTNSPYYYTHHEDGTGVIYSYHIDYCLGAQTGDIDASNHNATPAGLVDD